MPRSRRSGSGDVWFAVDTDGVLLTNAPADAADDTADATTSATDLADVLVDGDGLTLYGFTNDGDGEPTCDGDCADAWPPLVVDSADLPDELDPEIFSVVERADGTFQLKAGTRPLYRFAGDAEAGDVNGQGSGDVWFAAAPDGGRIKEATAAAGDAADGQAPASPSY
ncbi:hypothetical protein BH23ACT10_BH23ACT10_23130 [soil metagenome]